MKTVSWYLKTLNEIENCSDEKIIDADAMWQRFRKQCSILFKEDFWYIGRMIRREMIIRRLI